MSRTDWVLPLAETGFWFILLVSGALLARELYFAWLRRRDSLPAYTRATAALSFSEMSVVGSVSVSEISPPRVIVEPYVLSVPSDQVKDLEVCFSIDGYADEIPLRDRIVTALGDSSLILVPDSAPASCAFRLLGASTPDLNGAVARLRAEFGDMLSCDDIEVRPTMALGDTLLDILADVVSHSGSSGSVLVANEVRSDAYPNWEERAIRILIPASAGMSDIVIARLRRGLAAILDEQVQTGARASTDAIHGGVELHLRTADVLRDVDEVALGAWLRATIATLRQKAAWVPAEALLDTQIRCSRGEADHVRLDLAKQGIEVISMRPEGPPGAGRFSVRACPTHADLVRLSGALTEASMESKFERYRAKRRLEVKPFRPEANPADISVTLKSKLVVPLPIARPGESEPSR